MIKINYRIVNHHHHRCLRIQIQMQIPITTKDSTTIKWKEYYTVGGSSTIFEVNKCTRLNDPTFAYYTYCCRRRHHRPASRIMDGGINNNNNSSSIASHHSQDHDIIKLGNISLYRRCSDPMDVVVSSSSSSLMVSSTMPCHDEIRKSLVKLCNLRLLIPILTYVVVSILLPMMRHKKRRVMSSNKFESKVLYVGLLFCAIQPTVSTCIAMTKSDVKVAILDLNTLSNCCHCGSNEKLDEVVTPSRTTPLRSAGSATAAAMSALVDDEAAENVIPRTDELAAVMTTEKEIDEDTTPIRTGASAPFIAECQR